MMMMMMMKIDNEKKIHSLFSKSKDFFPPKGCTFFRHTHQPCQPSGILQKNSWEVRNIGFQRSPSSNISSTLGVGVGVGGIWGGYFPLIEFSF